MTRRVEQGGPGDASAARWRLTLVALTLAGVGACTAILGDDYSVDAGGPGPGGHAQGGNAQGGGGSAQGGGGSVQGGGGSALEFCVDVLDHNPVCDAPDVGRCLCASCIHDGICYDTGASLVDDCICRDCIGDPSCADGCNGDGQCDPYLESCACGDCAAHWACSCDKCSEHLLFPDPAVVLCPGSETHWEAAASCICNVCDVPCASVCEGTGPPDALCTGCIANSQSACANFLGPCQAE